MGNKKIIIIVVVAVVVFLLAVFFIKKSEFFLKKQPVTTQVVNTDPEKLDDYHLQKKAIKENNISICKELVNGGIQKCIFSVVLSNGNFVLCKELELGELQEKCYAESEYHSALSSNNMDSCNVVRDTGLKKRCFSEFFRKINVLDDCPDNEFLSLCQDMIYKKNAYEIGDIVDCDNISSVVLRDDCQRTVENKPKDSDGDGLLDVDEKARGTNLFETDTDGDGLNDYEEIYEHHTAPRNPDTDGDGYSDGDEVKNGFNPKGE